MYIFGYLILWLNFTSDNVCTAMAPNLLVARVRFCRGRFFHRPWEAWFRTLPGSHACMDGASLACLAQLLVIHQLVPFWGPEVGNLWSTGQALFINIWLFFLQGRIVIISKPSGWLFWNCLAYSISMQASIFISFMLKKNKK